MNDVMSDAEALAKERQDRPGSMLRRAREQLGLTIADVAEKTRVSQRQLEAIERSDFAALPGTPYAVGFARAYARAVGVDEVAVARGVREELGAIDASPHYEAFEPVDPARIPPRGLAWAAALFALLLAIGYGVWRTQFFAASTDQEISDLSNRSTGQDNAAPRPGTPPPAAAQPVGPVVLTATDTVWLRITDQSGNRLVEKEMSKGDSFTVPPDAVNPVIMTGRPDALAVTVGGRPVAPLGSPEKTIVDVPVSASALLARQQTPPISAAPPPASAAQPLARPPEPVGTSPTPRDTTAGPAPAAASPASTEQPSVSPVAEPAGPAAN